MIVQQGDQAHMGSEFHVGDQVTVIDDIELGSLVYFERTGPGDMTVHSLSQDLSPTLIGFVYRAYLFNDEGVVRFVLQNPGRRGTV